MPATSHVNSSTREKIVSGEYFRIEKLLPTLLDEADMEDAKDRKDKKLSFYNWIRCYRVFKSIRLEIFPNELQGMLRHEEIVQDLISRGKDGILYDAHFRRRKEQHPHIEFGEYLADIVEGLPMIQRVTPRRPIGNVTNTWTPRLFTQRQPVVPTVGGSFLRPTHVPPRMPTPQPISPYPRPVCNKYNSPSGCDFPRCQFLHKCKTCNKFGHGMSFCYLNRK